MHLGQKNKRAWWDDKIQKKLIIDVSHSTHRPKRKFIMKSKHRHCTGLHLHHVRLLQSTQSFHGALLNSAPSNRCWSSWHSSGNGWSAPTAGYFTKEPKNLWCTPVYSDNDMLKSWSACQSVFTLTLSTVLSVVYVDAAVYSDNDDDMPCRLRSCIRSKVKYWQRKKKGSGIYCIGRIGL